MHVPTGIYINQGDAIPKKNKPDKYQLIMDLSSPKNFSVNDGIDLAFVPIICIHWSSAIFVSTIGVGSYAHKTDIKEDYWIVLIHPLDKQLLGVQWREEVFIDKMLSFGLYSASINFYAVTDTH